MRRLLVVGGFLVCGWLLSGVQSAHAADGSPLPSITGQADVVGDVADTAGPVTEALRNVAAETRDRTPAPAPIPATAYAADKVAAPPDRPAAEKPPAGRSAAQGVAETARTVVDRPARTTPGGGTAASLTSAVSASAVSAQADSVLRSAGAPALPEVRAAEVAGFVNSAVTGLTGPTTTAGALTGTLGQPLGTLGRPLGTLTAPLGALTEPVSGLAGRLDQVAAWTEGMTGTLGPQWSDVIDPVAAQHAQLLGMAGTTTTVVVPETAQPAPAPAPAPAYPLVPPLQTAIPPVSAVQLGDVFSTFAGTMPLSVAAGSPRAIPGIPATGASRPTMLWPPRHPLGGSGSQLRSGPADDWSVPYSPYVPRSGDPSQALPTSSHGDFAGAHARTWDVGIPHMFVPAWVAAPPAVRTAADEPGFSPD